MGLGTFRRKGSVGLEVQRGVEEGGRVREVGHVCCANMAMALGKLERSATNRLAGRGWADEVLVVVHRQAVPGRIVQVASIWTDPMVVDEVGDARAYAILLLLAEEASSEDTFGQFLGLETEIVNSRRMHAAIPYLDTPSPLPTDLVCLPKSRREVVLQDVAGAPWAKCSGTSLYTSVTCHTSNHCSSRDPYSTLYIASCGASSLSTYVSLSHLSTLWI